MTRLTTGEIIAKSLIANGVDTVFGIPGAHMYEFNDALAREAGSIRFIHTRHEQGAGYMAYGYARSTGRPGVYTVVPGPGLLNSGAALCTAYGANAPLLCITGNIMSHLIGQGRGQLHELPDHLGTLRGLTKWAERINHPTEASGIMSEAFRQMQSGRPRPVGVEAPWDVFGMAADVGSVEATDPDPAPVPDADQVEQAAEKIAAARNPLIMVGGGALGAAREVKELADLLQAPVTAHRCGKGIMPDDDDLALLSPAAWKYWPGCDLIIGIGSRLEQQHFRWRWFPDGLSTVRIDIDPTEFVRLKPDAGILADAAEGTRALIDALRDRVGARADRSEEFRGYSAAAAEDLRSVQPQEGYLRAIRDVLPRDGFFVEEVSQVGFTARMTFPVYEPRTYVTCGYQDNLGFGFNTALGVKVANPGQGRRLDLRRRRLHVRRPGTGDGRTAQASTWWRSFSTMPPTAMSAATSSRSTATAFSARTCRTRISFRPGGEFRGHGACGRPARTNCDPALETALAADAPVVIEVPVPTGGDASPWPYLPAGCAADLTVGDQNRGDRPLLPLDGAGRLRRDIVDDPVDAPHLVDDAGGGAAEKLHVVMVEIGCHAVD